MEILNDYIIIEPQEVKLNSTLQLTAQDQSRLVYKDALVKFTPKNSRIKPGDTVVYNKAMAYPYVLDGKQHLIITEEYIVLIK
jgi:co-chaperonin GroES (HSP10)